jgi:hypothetical protein
MTSIVRDAESARAGGGAPIWESALEASGRPSGGDQDQLVLFRL